MSDICVRSYRQISYRGNMMSYHVTGKSTVIGMSNVMNVMHTNITVIHDMQVTRCYGHTDITNILILRTH